MYKRQFIDYAQDILDSIDKIEQFNKEVSLEQFQNDAKTVFATVRALEIIGEATNKLPSDILSDYPEIPWKDVIGMRNKLIHEYFGVDTEAVWKTIKEDLPKLKPVIIRILQAEEQAAKEALKELTK